MKVEVSKQEVVVQLDKKAIEVVVVGPQAPSGSGGGGGGGGAPSTPHDVLIDFVSSNPQTTIIGTAAVGSATSAPVWAIKKVIVPTAATMSILWADGNTNEDNVWDNRASLNYL